MCACKNKYVDSPAKSWLKMAEPVVKHVWLVVLLFTCQGYLGGAQGHQCVVGNVNWLVDTIIICTA